MARALAVSLILTIALEAGFFFLVGKRNKKDLLLLVLVNVLTNPIVVSSYWMAVLYTRWNRVAVTTLLELFAVSTEGFLYKKHGQDFGCPYLFSFAANAFSFGMGVLLQRIF
jgi:hypothetical protein